MTQSSNILSQEIAVMADVFSDLGERLLRTARELHNPGTPPPDTLVEELSVCRRDLEGLRDRARQLAESFQVPCPPVENLNSLQSLAALLDDVAEAEIRQSRCDEVRRRSHALLQRVISLTHISDPDYALLRDCKEKAGALQQQINEAHWTALPPDAERLAEGDHPFAHLLTLILDRDELSDELWAILHDSVATTYGKALAAAAVRSKLVLGQDHSSSTENGYHSPDEAHNHALAGAS